MVTTTHQRGAAAPAGSAEPTIQMQSVTLLGHVAGYIAHRTIDIGLVSGLLAALADRPGASPEDLADLLEMDDFYIGVWCRAALAAHVLERAEGGYRLAPHVGTLLLDASSPAYAGGLFPLFLQPEIFDRFAANLQTGERMWWNETTPEWIAGVAATGRPFYTRLVSQGLERIPGLAERLQGGCRVIDTACGTGTGLAMLAEAFPRCEIIGIDGDQHSIDQAAEMLRRTGLDSRVRLIVSALEQLPTDQQATVVINNISMHECRDLDRVAANIRTLVEPGGWFVISDFPFPESDEGLRTIPGRLMTGVQFFEAQIDDQLLPRSAYDDLLTRHGFVDTGWFELNPVHAVTYGRRPIR